MEYNSRAGCFPSLVSSLHASLSILEIMLVPNFYEYVQVNSITRPVVPFFLLCFLPPYRPSRYQPGPRAERHIVFDGN